MILPGRTFGRPGTVCHDSPQYDPNCYVYYGDPSEAPHAAPGVYYCFVCDTIERDYCAGCFLHEHDEHCSEARARESFEAGDRILLRGPGTFVWAASSEVAEQVRAPEYLDALEPYDWDETRVPAWLTPEHCMRREGLRRHVAALAACLEGLAVESVEMTRRLDRITRNPRKAHAVAQRLGAALLVCRTLPQERARRPLPYAAGERRELRCSTRCDGCGLLRAPYGPPPRECAVCLTRRLEA